MNTTPRLVQRLQAPQGANPFSFGCGLSNGGAPIEINNIVSFDYMGAAEFEFGAVGKAIEELENSELGTSTFIDKGRKVYVIAPLNILSDVQEWIKFAIGQDFGENISLPNYLKEPLEFNSPRNLGWLKIERDRRCEEPFMFFVDENMFNEMCLYLGLIEQAEHTDIPQIRNVMSFLSELEDESSYKDEDVLCQEIYDERGIEFFMDIIHPSEEIRSHPFFRKAFDWFRNAYV